MVETPIIETDRIILRPLLMEDAQDIFDRWTSDDRVSKYVRWVTHKSIEDTKEWVTTEIDKKDDDLHFTWGFILKNDNYLFGSGSINYNKENECYEVGYNIMFRFWNRGLATEATKAMIEYGRLKLSIKKFVAWHVTENNASGNVLQKCGFVYKHNELQTKFDSSTTFETKKYILEY